MAEERIAGQLQIPRDHLDYAAAIGAQIEFDPHGSMADPPLQVDGQFDGKIQRIHRA